MCVHLNLFSAWACEHFHIFLSSVSHQLPCSLDKAQQAPPADELRDGGVEWVRLEEERKEEVIRHEAALIVFNRSQQEYQYFYR